MTQRSFLVSILFFFICTKSTYSSEYTFNIQPIYPPERMDEIYKPLADYLSKQIDQDIKLSSFRSFRSYWYNMKRGKGFDIVLDAPHFTDYRIQKDNYKVLAKQPDTVSFTLVTRSDTFLFDMEELAGLKVAVMEAPSMSGIWVKEAFLDSDEKPTIVNSLTSEDCIKKLLSGAVDAAIIPTPLVGRYEGLNVVVTSEPIPHIAFSVSPKVPKAVADALKDALLNASKTDEGRKMLAAIKLAPFTDASAEIYGGYANKLNIMKVR